MHAFRQSGKRQYKIKQKNINKLLAIIKTLVKLNEHGRVAEVSPFFVCLTYSKLRDISSNQRQ